MNNFTINKINFDDKQYFIHSSIEFYNSPAVLHDIDTKYHEDTFDELMNYSKYIDCYIFKVDKTYAGYALLNKTYSREAGGIVIWIEELFVEKEFRSKKIGSEFLRWLENNIPAKRYRLEVEKDNIKAISLYKHLGYTQLPYLQLIKE
ncbi:MAG: GNAT family N-acetyltransferase [Eubacteriales bacterium]|nr:GNAT family N-acetyltransferase [Eubacteriales bacterium]MDY3333034.1 GNAT family N-acetyltransferase [Gallibacter sp.]